MIPITPSGILILSTTSLFGRNEESINSPTGSGKSDIFLRLRAIDSILFVSKAIRSIRFSDKLIDLASYISFLLASIISFIEFLIISDDFFIALFLIFVSALAKICEDFYVFSLNLVGQKD